jgi:monoterpene epsilon-lactone hydrolase
VRGPVAELRFGHAATLITTAVTSAKSDSPEWLTLAMPTPEHETLVAQIVATGQRTPEEPPDPTALAAMREAERAAELVAPPSVDVADASIGGVPCVVLSPRDAAPVGTIVYVHGGGYIWMSARSHVLVAAAIVGPSGCRCVSVDYRLAPEHPYPAPVEDLTAVHRALLAAGESAGRIAFAGDSAGGGLVLAGLVALRDAGDPLPAAAVSISPWTDLAVTGASADTADDPIVSGAGLRMMAGVYLAGADPTSPTASPLYADLSGLPPLLVQVGTRESLLDDARRVAARAREAGVDVTLHEFADVVHMWVVLGPELPETRDALGEAGAFVRDHFA